ncbi:hypothetical protein NP493_735g00013 [Ridgeia piscesae]|uniref:Uncharacterized protein n=1 Tax=Ridgeia piscesae TaxID=27915 RepID=A0AAD9NQ58_RIDPI|nr:hypothetical protein NP493_735g00013 [Ridgeia piscesae]
MSCVQLAGHCHTCSDQLPTCFRYIEEHVQRTGVAIETQGFTFITSGRKRESLTGNATLHLYPHFEPLRQIEGVVDYLSTEISTSKQKKFSLVTFIDTPGLVDGDMKYPFDVNHAITWLGDMADLIFVFFDPIGQALCKRTLNLVEHLNERHSEIMRFYLSKADEAGHESDRQRVMMQIVQELCKRPGLNRTSFDMPTIYIPNPAGKPSRCANQIEEVCKDVEKTINQTIQNTLNSLEKDCRQIVELIDEKVTKDREMDSKNFSARTRGALCCCTGLLLPLAVALVFAAGTASTAILESILGKNGLVTLNTYLVPLKKAWLSMHIDYQIYIGLAVVFLTLLFFLFAKLSSRRVPTLSRRQKKVLAENADYVQNYVHKKKQQLYQEYLQQCVAAHDL